MRERGQSIGAVLAIWSRAGGGTEVAMTVPAATAYLATTRRSRWFRFGRSTGGTGEP